MWIELYINGKLHNSWLINEIEKKDFTEAGLQEREEYWQKRISECRLESANILCECRNYCFFLRLKSAVDCSGLPEDEPEPIKATSAEPVTDYLRQLQEWFIKANAKRFTVKELAGKTGAKRPWIYEYIRKNKIDNKRINQRHKPYKITS